MGRNNHWKNNAPYVLMLLPIVVLIIIPNFAYFVDGVDLAFYMNNPEHPKMFHPHRLLFAPFGYGIYFILTSLGLNIRSLDMLVVMNIITGIILLVLCWILFNRLVPNLRGSGYIGVLIIGASYTFGTFFRNSDQYMIPLTLCTLIFLRVLTHLREKGKFKVTWLDWFIYFLAIMMHQMALFIFPAIIYAEINSGRVNPWRNAVIRSVALAICLMVSYITIYWLAFENPSIDSFIGWAIGYGSHDFWIFSFYEDRGEAIILSIVSNILSHKALFLAPINRTDILRLHEFKEFAGNEWFGEATGWLLFGLIITFIALGIRTMWTDSKQKMIAVFLILVILPLYLFLHVFVPFQSFYRMYYLAPLVIFALIGIASFIKTKNDRIAGSVFLVLFVAVNFLYGFIPESNPENNPYLVFAYDVKSKTESDDFFVIPVDDYFHVKYLRYFGNREICYIAPFRPENHPEVTLEDVRSRCLESTEEILRKYNEYYLYRASSIPAGGYIMLMPLNRDRGEDPVLLLQSNQIILGEHVEFADMVFHRFEIASLGFD